MVRCLSLLYHRGTQTAFSDYYGAKSAGFNALLLDRPGPENQQDAGLIPDSVEVVNSLHDVLRWVEGEKRFV